MLVGFRRYNDSSQYGVCYVETGHGDRPHVLEGDVMKKALLLTVCALSMLVSQTGCLSVGWFVESGQVLDSLGAWADAWQLVASKLPV